MPASDDPELRTAVQGASTVRTNTGAHLDSQTGYYLMRDIPASRAQTYQNNQREGPSSRQASLVLEGSQTTYGRSVSDAN